MPAGLWRPSGGACLVAKRLGPVVGYPMEGKTGAVGRGLTPMEWSGDYQRKMEALVRFVEPRVSRGQNNIVLVENLCAVLERRGLTDGECILAYADRCGDEGNLEILLLTDRRLARIGLADPAHVPSAFTWKEVKAQRVEAIELGGSIRTAQRDFRCAADVNEAGLLLPEGLSDPPAAAWWSWVPRMPEHFDEWESALSGL